MFSVRVLLSSCMLLCVASVHAKTSMSHDTPKSKCTVKHSATCKSDYFTFPYAKFTAKGPSYLVALDFQNRVTLAGAVKALRTVCTDLGYEKVGWITYSSWAKHDLVPPSTFKATYLNLKLKKARTCSSAQCNWVIGFECIPKGAKICNPDALGNYGSNNVGTGNFGNSNKGNGNVGNCNEGDRTWGANNQGARLFGYELKGNLQVSAAVFG